MNELKVGQRIDVYNVIANVHNMDVLEIGNTYIGETREGYVAVFIFTNAWYNEKGMTTMYEREVKLIGSFVVTGVKNNTDPCTII